MLESLGHVLLGGMFIWAGIDHFRRFRAVQAMLAARGWPSPALLLALASGFQICAGFYLVIGMFRPYAALGLAVFTVVATLLLLNFWRFSGAERDGMRNALVQNVGLLGGLLLVAGRGL